MIPKILALALSALVLASSAGAQTLRIMTVDMAQLLNGYYKTAKANEMLFGQVQAARRGALPIVEEGQALAAQRQELVARLENPAFSEEAQQQTRADIQALDAELRAKQGELEQYNQNTTQELERQNREQRSALIEEIRAAVLDLAKERTANLVFDTSKLGQAFPPVLYTDPVWDATKDAMARINRDAPPNSLNPDGTAIPFRPPVEDGQGGGAAQP